MWWKSKCGEPGEVKRGGEEAGGVGWGIKEEKGGEVWIQEKGEGEVSRKWWG